MTDYKSEIPLGDLLIGEMTYWQKGICAITTHKDDEEGDVSLANPPEIIEVRGETGLLLSLNIRRTNKDVIDAAIAEAIEQAHNEL